MSSSGGGAEKVLASVASGLAGRGHRVTVLTYDQPRAESYYTLNPSVRLVGLGLGPTTQGATLPTTLRRIRALRGVIQGLSPDAVIGFMHSMFIPLGLSLVFTGIPVIASEHIVYAHYFRRRTESFLLRLTPFVSEKITCVSEQVRESYPAFLKRHMVAIPNPVVVPLVGKADVRAAGRSRKILLSVGRFDDQKDHATLIDAFSRVAERLPEWDLKVVGDGYLRPRIQEQISELGMHDRIKLPGLTKDVSKEYLAAQLFVVPSRYESFSLVTAEALAHGLPVVGFADCPGVNQWITSGRNGLLVDVAGDRAESLALALRSLMENSELREQLSRDCGRIPEEFDLEHVLDSWETLIQSFARGAG